MSKKGVFTVSLDFELFWGVRDHRTIKNYGQNIANVHYVVPELLKLFKEYNIHCTWATVGFLFCKNKEELEKIGPHTIASYENPALNPYAYIRDSVALEEIYHFAPELIKSIRNTPGQEVGTHTLSHYYTLEKGADLASFRSDIEKAVQTGENAGLKTYTIIFPRNQYGKEHLKICAANGIKTFRGTESNWIYATRSRERETKLRRLIRLMDSYVNISGHHLADMEIVEDLLNIPASRFLRPYSPKLKFLESLRLKRILSSMEVAAKKGRIFHLWWHPHNFGSYTKENFAFLIKILRQYTYLHKKYQMQSLNMMELFESIEKNGTKKNSIISY